MNDDVVSRYHGGISHIEDVARSSPVLDASTCVDAFGLFEPVIRALGHVEATAAYRHYPDPESRRARSALARAIDADVDYVEVAPGAAELIWTLVRAVLKFGETALVWRPCFSEFEYAVSAVGGVLAIHEHTGEEIHRELQRFAATVRRVRPRLAYLCAPTCPRGEWVPAEHLRLIVANNPDTLFVIDQSYLGTSHHSHELTIPFPVNAALVRSLTKELGLPGVRVGYALLAPTLRARLQKQRPSWVLGVHSQAVFDVYGDCRALLETRRGLLLRQARFLGEALGELGFAVELRDTHYFAVNVARQLALPRTETPASAWTRMLLESGIAVRDCTSFGLPDRVRIVAHPEQQKLIDVWSRLAADSPNGGVS